MALKILILTPRIPYPLRDGGSIAMNQTLEAYIAQGCELSLLSMNTSRHWVEESALPDLYKKFTHFTSVYVKTNVNPLSAFLNLFTDKSYNVARFINKDFEQEIVKLLRTETFDMIQFESIYTAPYLKTVRQYSEAKCVCRVHNIEYLIWQRLSENESSFLKRKYLELLTTRLKNYELEALQKFDLLLPISQKEELYFIEKKLNACHYLPFGVNEKNNLPQPEQEHLSCFHIGSMDWAPNLEGVQWFLQQVWPAVNTEMKDVVLYLAGKNMPASLHSNEAINIQVLGEIDNVQQFILEKNIMLVPLLSGAGIRIKIIEAMAMGKTIISTSIGVDGIGVTHQENILIADTAEEFLIALQFCFKEKEKAKRIGANAKEFVHINYQKERIYDDLIKRIKLLIQHA